MQKFITILIAIALCGQLVARLAITTWYESNKEYVTENFCENKSKPELNCCGKCYLNKQLAKADDHSDKSGSKNNSSLKSEKVECVVTEPFCITKFVVPAKEPQNGVYTNISSTGLTRSVFHPPLA